MKLKSLLITILLLATSTLLLPQAQGATKGWRYWGYFQAAPGALSWNAAMTGPTVDIADGAVEGWSFVFSSDDVPSQVPTVFLQIGTLNLKITPLHAIIVIYFNGSHTFVHILIQLSIIIAMISI